MTTSNAPSQDCSNDRAGRDQQGYVGLVWIRLNDWAQETRCGRYRVERFVAGLIRDIKLERPGPNRYRALKRAPEWWGEFCPPAESADLAKQACEEDLNGTAADAGSTLVAAPMHTLPEAETTGRE